MTKAKLEAYRRLYNRLEALGFDGDEVDALCRIERTLSRWSERECNGEVETDDDTGFAFAVWDSGQSNGKLSRYRVPNREAGALRRLSKIMQAHPKYIAYHQTDPRGCALYIVDMGENPPETVSSSYTNGIAVFA